MPIMDSPQKPRKWIDFSINFQSLVSAFIGAGVVLVMAWFGLVGRVQALEQKNVQHAEHFARLEAEMSKQRQDVKDQLSAIGQNVEKIRDYLLDNAAGSRPDIRRWTK